jgi:hypothetical protein
MGKEYKSLDEFYKFYKKEHGKTGTRVLHVVGTTLFLGQATSGVALQKPQLVLSGIVSAYACAWIGHFFVEQNRPATFKYPFYSLLSDFKMFWNIISGRESIWGS